MPSLPAIAGLVALLFASAAAAAPLGERRQAIIDGAPVTTAPGNASAALLAIADDGHQREGAFMCSAVLVSPQLALTAAHCVALVEADADEEGWQLDWWLSFAPDVRGFDGPDPRLPPATVAVIRVDVHPRFAIAGPPRSDRLDAAHDIAVLHLAEPAPVAPVPIARPSVALQDAMQDGMRDGMPDGTVGRVWIAGHGFEALTDDAVAGRLSGGPSRLIEVGSHELRVGRRARIDEPVPSGLAEKCGGDSGGATLIETRDGWRVIGLTSRAYAGDAGCAIAGIDTRVDAYADWIDESAAPDATRTVSCSAAPGEPDSPGLPGLPGVILLGLAARRRCHRRGAPRG